MSLLTPHPQTPGLSQSVESAETLALSPRLSSPSPSPPSIPSPKELLLANEDVLRVIFSQILPLDGDLRQSVVEARMHLLRISLTCRAFRDPALDCLWRCIGSLVPLIRLLPSVEESNGALICHEAVAFTGRTKFERYAKQVRTLEISGRTSCTGTSITVDSTVYVVLAQGLGANPLFKGLEAIKVLELPDSFSWHSLPLLLSSQSLQTVEVAGAALTSDWFPRFGLPMLATRTRSLKHLSLQHSTKAISSSLWEQVLSFQELESLSLRLPLSNLPGDFIARLETTSNHLSRLTLDVHHPSHTLPDLSQVMVQRSTPEELSSINPLAYHRIQSLSLINRSETTLCECFSDASLLLKLTSLTLKLTQTSLSALPTFAQRLASCPLLKKLELDDATSFGSHNLCISVDQIVCFLQNISLEDFTINVYTLRQRSVLGSGYKSPDACLDEILSHAFSSNNNSLRSLSLPRFWESDSANLRSLSYVAHKAPSLRRFHFTLHSWEAIKLTAQASFPNMQAVSSLQYLEIRDLRTSTQPFTVDEYRTIAEYLDLHFPNLISLAVSSKSNDYCRKQWEFIEHLRKIYKENRVLKPYLRGGGR